MKPIDFGEAANASPGASVLDRGLAIMNKALMLVAGLALLAAALVLTESVILRYLLKISTEWQDETAVFLLVGATFLSAPFIQSVRGHVGIDALREVLSPRANYFRSILVDVVSLFFCTFFAWKSWTLLHEALVEGQHTASSFGPPLWIPYSAMSIGMTLLCLQILAQLMPAKLRSNTQ